LLLRGEDVRALRPRERHDLPCSAFVPKNTEIKYKRTTKNEQNIEQKAAKAQICASLGLTYKP